MSDKRVANVEACRFKLRKINGSSLILFKHVSSWREYALSFQRGRVLKFWQNMVLVGIEHII